MSKELTALEVSNQLKDFVLGFVKNGLDRRLIHGSFDVINQELKESERKDDALKTISDIIRDFNKGEFANGECALEEITNILKEVLE